MTIGPCSRCRTRLVCGCTMLAISRACTELGVRMVMLLALPGRFPGIVGSIAAPVEMTGTWQTYWGGFTDVRGPGRFAIRLRRDGSQTPDSIKCPVDRRKVARVLKKCHRDQPLPASGDTPANRL